MNKTYGSFEEADKAFTSALCNNNEINIHPNLFYFIRKDGETFTIECDSQKPQITPEILFLWKAERLSDDGNWIGEGTTFRSL